jgi:acetoacetate decarboxylase
VALAAVDGEVSARITTTRGTPVVRVAGRLGDPDDTLVPDWFGTQFTLKLIPSATGVGFDVNRLVRVPFTFADRSDVRAVDATVTLAESAADPLHLLPVRAAGAAAYGRTGLHVGYGTYLDEVTAIPTLGRPAG